MNKIKPKKQVKYKYLQKRIYYFLDKNHCRIYCIIALLISLVLSLSLLLAYYATNQMAQGELQLLQLAAGLFLLHACVALTLDVDAMATPLIQTIPFLPPPLPSCISQSRACVLSLSSPALPACCVQSITTYRTGRRPLLGASLQW